MRHDGAMAGYVYDFKLATAGFSESCEVVKKSAFRLSLFSFRSKRLLLVFPLFVYDRR